MNYTTYNELKNISYKKEAFQILDRMRGNIPGEISTFLLIQLSYLALKYKPISSKEELIEFITSDFNDEYTLNQLNRVIQKVPFEIIEQLSDNYDENTLKAIVLFSEDNDVRSELSGTPLGLAKLVNELLEIQPDDTVLDLGSGVGSYLLETKMETGAVKVCGVEINIQKNIISTIRAKVAQFPIELKLGNILSQDYRSFKATKVFSNPPVGLRDFGIDALIKDNKALTDLIDIEEYNISADWAFILSSYANQEPGGKTAVLMSNQVLFREQDYDIREKIISEGWLEAIIALPEKLFPYTTIPFTLLIFSEKNETVRMVDASEISTRDQMKNILTDKNIQEIVEAYQDVNEISKRLTYEDFRKQEFVMTPIRYFGFIPDASNMTPIGDLARSINRGATISRKEIDTMTTTKETGIKYLKIQDIDRVSTNKDLPNLSNVDAKYHNYFLEEGDLVISKSSPYKIARVENIKNIKILATGNLYYIKIDEEKVNPTFVEMYLKSDEGQAQLERLSTGSVIETISIKNLKNILIPNLSRKEQDTLVKEYLEYEEQLDLLDRQREIITQRRKELIEKGL
ncbi:N-6 DNA methylase [Aerococcus urinaeequi]|uniref:site-specific DNA-methyltransferase (adenine-specific) n=1 Tax=Aerococcus urinaeequi TaxID=51665 RepID=A0A7M1KQI1_9LACT|nr:N-6 DNA methylase [Aerococcus urinaeequi]QOQ78601.1 N-6 DNA methylase [Aerococcus urinaeequi]